ncbi:PP2C family protein-serine/threonine phosphatase [Dermatophilus congolensis]|uniref:PP2C-family Ser/Thr phosphatase n=1 Tax=Dermatophilus congolensis TaxID=1863 RepID=A0AA46BQ43_9MICO|nr:PP2C family serine/threonine-protein phosphatase [Dermatophilus congolensis]MBO3143860.1 serine/threonine-protein phosphatase [Dermatophilus congolensis]MBO3152851.1 serine/threonine-protein phosphatase [Dermatophilus congolensis]MBO3160139.1 serine/threonine-protein phosphatase [Dermatophilus congolensis]MBO3164136.1 serine/threonine-protein phosphatase [Dermatophilus congolensis]MBO3177682.1 serine/threonine-protein phosphatase [Dermatophilus congolensis]
MGIAWNYAARTDVGLVRSRNEDSGYAGPHLIAIADGMGGHAGGNVASSLVISRIARLDGDSHGCDDALELLARTVAEANNDINTAVEEHHELNGMGTTFTGLMRCGADNLVLVHIGDSRAFMVRDEQFTQITIDHSFVQSLVDAGRISPEDAENHPQRSLVTRVLTGAPEDEPDLSVRRARPGDRYVICSDGLSDYVSRSTIEEVITAGMPPVDTLKKLIDLALKAGAPDNVTVVIADVTDEKPDSPHHPIVVGAAAENGERPDPTAALSPAQKAAAFQAQTTGKRTEPDTGEEIDDGSSATDRRTRRSGILITLLTLATVTLGLVGAYAWTQQQRYLGIAGDIVGVYRGIPQSIGAIPLSHVERDVSDIKIENLPDYYRSRLAAAIPAADDADIENQIQVLRVQQAQCLTRMAAGAPCGVDATPAPPTSQPSPTSTTSSPSGSAAPTVIPASPPTAEPPLRTPRTAQPVPHTSRHNKPPAKEVRP